MAARCCCCQCVIPDTDQSFPVDPANELCSLCLLYGDDEMELKNQEAAMAAEDDR